MVLVYLVCCSNSHQLMCPSCCMYIIWLLVCNLAICNLLPIAHTPLHTYPTHLPYTFLHMQHFAACSTYSSNGMRLLLYLSCWRRSCAFFFAAAFCTIFSRRLLRMLSASTPSMLSLSLLPYSTFCLCLLFVWARCAALRTRTPLRTRAHCTRHTPRARLPHTPPPHPHSTHTHTSLHHAPRTPLPAFTACTHTHLRLTLHHTAATPHYTHIRCYFLF